MSGLRHEQGARHVPRRSISIFKRPSVRYGIPFVSFVLLGTLGLGHVLQGRGDYMQAREEREWELLADAKARQGKSAPLIQPNKNPIDLEKELKAVQEAVDINKFDYKRVPKSSSQDS